MTKAQLIEENKALKKANELFVKQTNASADEFKKLKDELEEKRIKIYNLEKHIKEQKKHAAFLILNQVSELKYACHLLHPFHYDRGITHNEKRYRAKLAIETLKDRIVYLTEVAVNDVRKLDQYDFDLPF